jgi:hypothetical protein
MPVAQIANFWSCCQAIDRPLAGRDLLLAHADRHQGDPLSKLDAKLERVAVRLANDGETRTVRQLQSSILYPANLGE